MPSAYSSGASFSVTRRGSMSASAAPVRIFCTSREICASLAPAGPNDRAASCTMSLRAKPNMRATSASDMSK